MPGGVASRTPSRPDVVRGLRDHQRGARLGERRQGLLVPRDAVGLADVRLRRRRQRAAGPDQRVRPRQPRSRAIGATAAQELLHVGVADEDDRAGVRVRGGDVRAALERGLGRQAGAVVLVLHPVLDVGRHRRRDHVGVGRTPVDEAGLERHRARVIGVADHARRGRAGGGDGVPGEDEDQHRHQGDDGQPVVDEAAARPARPAQQRVLYDVAGRGGQGERGRRRRRARGSGPAARGGRRPGPAGAPASARGRAGS